MMFVMNTDGMAKAIEEHQLKEYEDKGWKRI